MPVRIAAAVIAAAAILVLAASAASAPIKAKGSPRNVSGTSDLRDVDCPTSGPCVAVGDANRNRTPRGVVVTIGRGKPRVRKVSSTFDLVSIDCPKPGHCIAVGEGGRNGTAGALVSITNGKPGRAKLVKGVTFQAVGCSATFSCWITAFRVRGSKATSLIFHARGRKPTRATAASTRGIAFGAGEGATPPAPVCPSANRCLGVGVANNGRGPGVVYTMRNGSITGEAKVAQTHALTALTCTSARSCIATGFGGSGAGRGVVVTVTNGNPGPARTASGTTYLGAIDCLKAATHGQSCVADGIRNSKPVYVPVYNGGPKQAQSGKQPATGIGCAISQCVAVGTSGRYPNLRGFFQQLKG